MLLVACGVLKGLGIPLADLFDNILGQPTGLKWFEGNSACITAIKAGQSPTMRHLKRCHNVTLKWLHDVLTQSKSFALLACPSKEMIADIFTLPFPDKKGNKYERRALGKSLRAFLIDFLIRTETNMSRRPWETR